MKHGLIPYIGGKHRLANRLVEKCHATGADVFVDVFGGSAAVLLAAHGKFGKLIYNDVDGDLVNLFRVVSDPESRVMLFRLLRWLPPSRRVFEDDYQKYLAGGHSFCRVSDPVERARRTLYRHLFSFGGKVRNGGFAISYNGQSQIKEVVRYRNTLRKLARVGRLFRNVLIENEDFSETVRKHGSREQICLFVDPPYDGHDRYYSRAFGQAQHVLLAQQLASVHAQVVCTFYDTPLIRGLYPASDWHWESIQATKNCCLTRGNKVVTNEFVITKRRKVR